MKRTLVLLLLTLMTAACGDQREPPVIPPGVLQVGFESVPYETTLDYLTDLAFTPDASGEFLAIGLYGKFEHAQLSADGAVPLMSGSFDDVYAEFDADSSGSRSIQTSRTTGCSTLLRISRRITFSFGDTLSREAVSLIRGTVRWSSSICECRLHRDGTTSRR